MERCSSPTATQITSEENDAVLIYHVGRPCCILGSGSDGGRCGNWNLDKHARKETLSALLWVGSI